MRILIAEDDEGILELLTAIVSSQFECEIEVAGNGQEAVDKINTLAPFDLVISDYHMPKKTGGDVFVHLRSHYKRVPFILISSHMPSEFPEFKEAAHVGSVLKPFEDELLLGQIQLLTEKTELKDWKAGFIPISIEILRKVERCNLGIYLELGPDHFVKVLKADAPFGTEEYQKYKSKNIKSLWIESSQFSNFIGQFRRNVFAKVDWDQMDPEQALESLSHDWELISKASHRFGWSPSIISLAKKNIAIAIQVLAKNPDLKKHIQRFQKSEGGRMVDHSFLLVNMCSAIVNELGWKAEMTLQKLTFAALLHDVDLDEELFSTKQTLLNAGAIEDIKTQPELKIILEHPRLAAERLVKWPNCPADVDRLILEHHERPDGQGFPRGLNFQQIFPLSAVMILAEDVIYHCADNFGVRPADYLESKRTTYDRGEFKNIFAAAMKCLSA